MFDYVGEKNNDLDNSSIFKCEEPSFEGGQYRINFRGRSIPSVKNMQILKSNNYY